MRKYVVLTILFVLPLVVYLFFASGINHFAQLPVLTNDVVDVSEYSEDTFKNKISYHKTSKKDNSTLFSVTAAKFR